MEFHGTHCAGIAAASTGNAIGIASVSWNVKYMAVQADENNNLAWGWDGIVYAANMGADVISCSWGAAGSMLTRLWPARGPPRQRN